MIIFFPPSMGSEGIRSYLMFENYLSCSDFNRGGWGQDLRRFHFHDLPARRILDASRPLRRSSRAEGTLCTPHVKLPSPQPPQRVPGCLNWKEIPTHVLLCLRVRPPGTPEPAGAPTCVMDGVLRDGRITGGIILLRLWRATLKKKKKNLFLSSKSRLRCL